MKISKLRIKNLNSLKGEFGIDFAGPPFDKSGIFAITGPTGAGKTTILDAICVALFGQTPRLGVGDSEELMSRHTSECYAEVEFAVKDGNFRSKWSQRRARGKIDGNLQPAAMELAKLTGNGDNIIEDKKSRVPAKVEEITGLDFPRFTRSVLLAQGGFAAFLNADDNERADLLEKMTGTEIYSKISREVFYRAKEENLKLNTLNIQKDSLKLMPQDEIKVLKKELEERREAAKKVGESLKTIQNRLKWLNDLKALEKADLEIRKDLETISEEQKRLKTDFKRLENHLKAAALKGEYDLLEKVRKDLKRLSMEISDLEKKIPEIEKKLKNTESGKEKENQAFNEFKKERDIQEKRISEAELKDSAIVTQHNALGELKKAQDRIQIDLKNLNREEDEAKKDISKILAEIDGCNRYLKENEKDADLSHNLPLIQERLNQLSGHRKKRKDYDAHLNEITRKNTDLDIKLKHTGQKLEESEKGIQKLSSEKSVKESTLKSLLCGKSQDDLEDEKAQIEKRKVTIDSMTGLASDLKDCEKKQADIQEKLTVSGNSLTALEAQHKKLLETLKQETEILGQLEQKRTLEMMAAKYEEDRKRLKLGEPCPLCGSLEHPWVVAGMVPEPEGTESVLRRKKKQVEGYQKEAADTVVKIVEINSSLKHLDQEKNDLAEKQADLLNDWKGYIQKLAVEFSHTDQDTLQDLSKTAGRKLDECDRLIKQVKELKPLIDKMNEQIISLEKDRADLNLNLSGNEGEKRQAETERNRVQKDLKTINSDIEDLHSVCARQLGPFGVSVPEPGAEEVLLEKLQSRDNDFKGTRTRREALEKKLGPLRERRIGLESRINTQKEKEAENREQLTSLENAITGLQTERKALIGDDDPKELKRKLKDRYQKYEETLDQFEKQISDARADLASNTAVLNSRKIEKRDASTEENRRKEAFLSKLKITGFSDETDFRAALMDPEAADMLQEKKTNLHERSLQAKTRLDDIQKRLTHMRTEPLTTQSLEEVESEQTKAERNLTELQNSIGEIQGTLKHQKALKKEQKNLLKDIERQQNESSRWDKLNALIGSADGKKYRRYAQGLTLDYLIQLANINLMKLNDRYVLQREKDKELSIEVIDTYQADVTRPTQTLSGGETFLVSLALALGLSNLAGRNATIDSLFLDEGFGSLDAETLETALAAIDTIHASGKTIGVISHVEALKERIPVQIQVQSLSGGVSELSIVG